MSQLYPPYLNSVLPAFAGSTIKIPFTMNPAVSNSDVKGFAIKIKSAYSNNVIANFLISGNSNITKVKNFLVSGVITWTHSDLEKLTPGNFYKIQIGYLDSDSDTNVLYSAVSLVKKCISPDIKIENLDDKENNEYPHTFTGVYSINPSDSGEKLYSSKFIIREKNTDNIIATSDEIIHNINNDTISTEARETYTFKQDLELDTYYTITWEITTSNGFIKSTNSYLIIQTNGLKSPLADLIDLQCDLNRDEGFISISANKKNGISLNGNKLSKKYSILLCRAKKSTGYTLWETLYESSLQKLNKVIFKDYTIENGEEYKYSIQTVENLFYSARIVSNSIVSYYEDIYLYDGKIQLKIKFNPKIGNLKTIFSENKIETLGSQYPYIFRNGNIKYKEFSLSGLISYLGDDNQEFFNLIDLLNYQNSLTDENIYNEKMFRDKVYEWLTNGKEKLFKSPTEGNMIIRLMNVSLSPTDSLSRMIYTFNSTAYEIASSEVDGLKQYKILPTISSGLKQKQYYNYGKKVLDSKKMRKKYTNAVITDIKITSHINDEVTFSIGPEVQHVFTYKGESFILKDVAFTEFTLESKKKNLQFSVAVKYYKQTTKIVKASSYTQVLTGVASDVDYNFVISEPQNIQEVNSTLEEETPQQQKTMEIVDVQVAQRPEEKFNIDFSQQEDESPQTILSVFQEAATVPNTLYSMWSGNKLLGYCLKIIDEVGSSKSYFYDSSTVNENTKYNLTFANNNIEENSSKVISVLEKALTPLTEIASEGLEKCEDLSLLKVCPGLQTQVTYAIKLYSLIDKVL